MGIFLLFLFGSLFIFSFVQWSIYFYNKNRMLFDLGRYKQAISHRYFSKEIKINIRPLLLKMIQDFPHWTKKSILGIFCLFYITFCLVFNLKGTFISWTVMLSIFYLAVAVPTALVRRASGIEYVITLLYMIIFFVFILDGAMISIFASNKSNGKELFIIILLITNPLLFITFDALKRVRNSTFSLFLSLIFFILTFGVIFFSYGLYNIQHFVGLRLPVYPHYSSDQLKTILYYGLRAAFQFPESFKGAIVPALEFVFFWFYSFTIGGTILANVGATNPKLSKQGNHR